MLKDQTFNFEWQRGIKPGQTLNVLGRANLLWGGVSGQPEHSLVGPDRTLYFYGVGSPDKLPNSSQLRSARLDLGVSLQQPDRTSVFVTRVNLFSLKANGPFNKVVARDREGVINITAT